MLSNACCTLVARAIRQARDDRARGKHLRIGRQHRRRHRAAGREPGDEHAAAVDAMRADRLLDHLADRERLAAIARSVAGQKPVEAGLRIVRGRLLGQQQHEAVSIRERGPARAEIVARGRLRAAVQHDDQRGRGLQLLRRVGEHAQRARVGTEAGQLGQMARCGCLHTRRPIDCGGSAARSTNAGGSGRAPRCVCPSLRTRCSLFCGPNARPADWLLRCNADCCNAIYMRCAADCHPVAKNRWVNQTRRG